MNNISWLAEKLFGLGLVHYDGYLIDHQQAIKRKRWTKIVKNCLSWEIIYSSNQMQETSKTTKQNSF